MSQAQRVQANTVGIQATEAHQDQRLHMIAEQRDFFQAANGNSEVERTRWSTVLQYQKGWFHQGMHDRNICAGAVGRQAVNEEEAELIVHSQTDECRLLSIEASCEKSKQSCLQNLKDLKKQCCYHESGIGTVSASDILAKSI